MIVNVLNCLGIVNVLCALLFRYHVWIVNRLLFNLLFLLFLGLGFLFLVFLGLGFLFLVFLGLGFLFLLFRGFQKLLNVKKCLSIVACISSVSVFEKTLISLHHTVKL